MRQYARAWLRWRVQTGQINQVTAREQRYVISWFIDAMGNRQPKQIGESDLERWRASMTGRLSPGTIRLRWRTAFLFLEWLVDEGKIRRNPARRIPNPKVPRSVHRNLRPDQATAIHDACMDDRERLIVTLGFQLGMRRSEIARAQLGDVDFVARTIRIIGKGQHERVIALTDQAARSIRAYTESLHIQAGPLVRNVEGTHGLSPGYVGALFERVARRAGVKTRGWDGVGTHSARHTAGTDVAHRSKNPMIVRDFLGHASLATTNGYIGSVDLEEQRRAIEGRRYAS
ncbi:MAG: tyrosine-type recombinase/integrase [Nitrospirota bacterium]